MRSKQVEQVRRRELGRTSGAIENRGDLSPRCPVHREDLLLDGVRREQTVYCSLSDGIPTRSGRCRKSCDLAAAPLEHVATKWPSKTLPLWQLVLDDAPIPSDFVQSLIDHDPAAVKELVERRTASFNAVDGDYACEVHMTAYSRPAKPLLPPLTLDNAQIDALAERATHIAIVATHRNLGEEAETIELYSFAQLRGPTLDGMTVAVEVVPKTPAAERLRLHTKLIGFFRQDANGRFALIDQTLGVIPLTRALALRLHR